MKRVKYSIVNGMMVSKDMIAHQHLVKSVVNPSDNSFEIRLSDDSHVLYQGKGRTKPETLLLARKALKDAGVVFGTEMRRRTRFSDIENEVSEE